MPLALEGIKIIEMGPYAPANMAGQWLGDLGADVIVVEPPNNRALGPAWSNSDRFRPENNRNKRMIILDLQREEARTILHQMVKEADVLIEANRPGIAKRLGFDYETLKAINPRIIVASLTHYGQKGPYANYPAHGLNFEAIGGWHLTQGQGLGNMGGDFTGKPWVNPFNLPDIKSAPIFTITILAALYARERTGRGQYIDNAILDSVIAVGESRVQPRGDEAYARATPGWNIYECKDGKYIATCATEEIQWTNLCVGLGVPDLAKDRGATGQRAHEVIAALQRAFKAKTRDEWFVHLNKLDTQAAKLNTIAEAKEDPQVKIRDMHVVVTGNDGYREIQYGSPFKLSDSPARRTHRRAPRVGEYTGEILKELGYKVKDIAKLRDTGAVK